MAREATQWTGDRAYLRLVGKHGTALLRLAYLLTGNRFDAEDVVQDVLISVAAKWLIVRPTPGYAYLKRAVANRAIDVIRKRREIPVGELLDADATSLRIAFTSPGIPKGTERQCRAPLNAPMSTTFATPAEVDATGDVSVTIALGTESSVDLDIRDEATDIACKAVWLEGHMSADGAASDLSAMQTLHVTNEFGPSCWISHQMSLEFVTSTYGDAIGVPAVAVGDDGLIPVMLPPNAETSYDLVPPVLSPECDRVSADGLRLTNATDDVVFIPWLINVCVDAAANLFTIDGPK